MALLGLYLAGGIGCIAGHYLYWTVYVPWQEVRSVFLQLEDCSRTCMIRLANTVEGKRSDVYKRLENVSLGRAVHGVTGEENQRKWS
jgi:hypothetical protein